MKLKVQIEPFVPIASSLKKGRQVLRHHNGSNEWGTLVRLLRGGLNILTRFRSGSVVMLEKRATARRKRVGASALHTSAASAGAPATFKSVR